MASRSERRAALAGRAPEPSPTTTTTEDDEAPMKIQFVHVYLDKEIPRFGDKGLASSSSTFFKAADGCAIELDTATGLVRLSKGGTVMHIPREKVSQFGDVLAPVAAVEPPAKPQPVVAPVKAPWA